MIKAIQYSIRLAMLNVLESNETCVCPLSLSLRTSRLTVSRHLIQLHEAALVVNRRLADLHLNDLLKRMANAAPRSNRTGRIEGCPNICHQGARPKSHDETPNYRTLVEARQI